MPIPAMRRRTFIASLGGTAAWPMVAREHREPDNFVRRSNHDIYGISLQKAAAQAMVGRQYWDHWDKFGMRPVLQALRSEAGEQMVLQDNFFIEKVLPGAMLRKLSDEEMAEYRRPFAGPGEGRRPTLTFPREIPIEGDPADVTAAVDAYADWLKSSSVPKLFVKAEPGGILADGKVLELARSLPAQTEVTVKGVHFVQEDSPDEIGRAIAAWMKTLG